MVIKIATHILLLGKALINFPVGFSSGIHYVPMGMAQGESMKK